MKKYLLTAILAASALVAAARPAHADPIFFDPTGTGTGFIPVGGLDWAPGNGIAVGANLGTNQNTNFTVFFQAQMNFLSIPSIDVQNAMLVSGAKYFTVVAGFGETVLSNTAGVINFGFDAANPVNFFAIYANDAPSSNLNGTGFVSGTAILVGHITGDAYSSTFTTNAIAPVALDGASGDGNNYPTQTTVTGTGDSTIHVVIDSYNTNYLVGLSGATLTTVINSGTGTAIPFDTVDPAACFFAATVGGSGILQPACTGGGVPAHGGFLGAAARVGVGSIDGTNDGVFSGLNGNSVNTMLKIDANSSFLTVPNAVPEPATLGLLGFGLLGAVAASRRLRRKQ